LIIDISKTLNSFLCFLNESIDLSSLHGSSELEGQEYGMSVGGVDGSMVGYVGSRGLWEELWVCV